MKYWATNGITRVELSEDEAREHYENAPHVEGQFGREFTTYPVGEMGHVLHVGATTYTPVKEAPVRRRRTGPAR